MRCCLHQEEIPWLLLLQRARVQQVDSICRRRSDAHKLVAPDLNRSGAIAERRASGPLYPAMPRTLFLSLIVVVVALSHMCAADLSIRWAYNVPNGQILERLAVSSDMSFVVSSVEFAASSFLYAFSADPGTTSGALLWQIQVQAETTIPHPNLGRPSISPDGKYIAVGCQGCTLKNVFVFAINSNSPSLLWSSQLKFGTNIMTFEGIPGWRPDSSAVYFQDTSYGQLVEFQVSGQTVTQVTIGTGGGPSSPAMSQDGKYLYVCASKGGAIVKGILAQYTLPLQSNPAPSSQLVTPAPCGSTGRLTSTNMLYIGDNGGLNAIDTSNGVLTRKWYYPTASVPVYSAPAIVSYTSSSSPSQQVTQQRLTQASAAFADFRCRLWSSSATTSRRLPSTRERISGAQLLTVKYREPPRPSSTLFT